MSTTENGWTNEWPEVNGFYWLRGWRHYADLPIKVDGDEFWMMFNLAASHRMDLGDSEDVEFLGPFTAQDLEQLAALRKAASEARDVLALLVPYGKIHTVEGVRYPDGTHSEAVDRGERVLNELRRIIGKEWESRPELAQQGEKS